MQKATVDFSDIDLTEIDLFDIQVLDSSDSVAFPETGASRYYGGLLGSCSCSCCWVNEDIIGGG